jgi:hypothetical protein
LIAAYSFSFYRGRQIDEFLEKKNSEYQSSVCRTKDEIETMEDWEIAHTCKAHCLCLEYLIQETERIRSLHSKNPFLPYTKAFSYCEMWSAAVSARGHVIADFWSLDDDNLYAEMEKMCEGSTCADILQTEEYSLFVQEVIESTKTFEGKDIDVIYGELLQEHAYPLSLYEGVIQERKYLAEKAYRNYKESVSRGDLVGSLVHSRIIFTLWNFPNYEGMLFWFDKAGYLVFDELNIHMGHEVEFQKPVDLSCKASTSTTSWRRQFHTSHPNSCQEQEMIRKK